MTLHIDINDMKYRDAAEQVLSRHDNFQPEANITSAVRDFLILSGLARSEEIVEEDPPSDASRRAVDLTALDTFVEFKRRIGTASGGEPDPENVRQLDDYLAQSASQGRVRMGVLTDGKRWLLRWPGAGEVRLTRPYFFTLEDSDGWFPLYEWLRDTALVSLEDVAPDREGIAEHFGPGSPSYQRDIAALKALYHENAGLETIRVKRRLWYDLLRTALGEVAYSTEGISDNVRSVLGEFADDTEEMDDLFVRHTYLGAVIGMVVQASFGIDIRRLAETDPADLLQGRELFRATGLQGVLESDFFAWPNEVGGIPLLQTLARRVARFNWSEAPPDNRRHPVRNGHTPRGAAAVGRILHPRLAGPGHGPGTGGQPAAPAGSGPGLRLRHLRRRGGVPLHRGRLGYRLGTQGSPEPAAGSGHRHRRSPGGGAPGPGRLDPGRPPGHQRCRRFRVRSVPVHPRLPGRRPATALPHRGYVRPERNHHPDQGR